MSELRHGYKLEADASEFVQRRDRVYISVNTPKNFEKVKTKMNNIHVFACFLS